MQPSPTIAIVYADGILNDESEETQPISGCGRRLAGYRNKVVDDEEDSHEQYYSSQDADHGGGRRKGAATGEYTGSSTTRQHGELAYYDLDEEAGKVTVVAAAGEHKIVSFATADVTESDDDNGSMIPESARLEETTTTATQRQWQQHQDQLEPNLLIILPTIQVLLGAGRRGDETTTISTLSFGYSNKAAPVHVVTPRETPWNYFGIGLALIVSAVSAFLIAFYVVLRR
jgi:hypothetical protein